MPPPNQLEENLTSQAESDTGYTDYARVDIPRSNDFNGDDDSGIPTSQSSCQSSNGALCDETRSQKIRMSSEEDQQEDVDTPQGSIPSEMGMPEYSKATDDQHIYEVISSDSEADIADSTTSHCKPGTDHKKAIIQPVIDPPLADGSNGHISSFCLVDEMDADDSVEYESDISEDDTSLKNDAGYQLGFAKEQDLAFELPSESDASSGRNGEFESEHVDNIQMVFGRGDHDTVCSPSCQLQQNTTAEDEDDTSDRIDLINNSGLADSVNNYQCNNGMFSDKKDSMKLRISSDQEEQAAEYSQVGKNQHAYGREASVTDSISAHSELDTEHKKDVIQPVPGPSVVDGSNSQVDSPHVVMDIDADYSDEYETESSEDDTNLKSDDGYRGGSEMFPDLVFELPPSSYSGSDVNNESMDDLEAGHLDNIQIKLDQESHEAAC